VSEGKVNSWPVAFIYIGRVDCILLSLSLKLCYVVVRFISLPGTPGGSSDLRFKKAAYCFLVVKMLELLVAPSSFGD
jgi:hypothetical protein